MNRFAYGTPARLGTVCEGGTVATLYDCNARTSLYAATVLDGANMGGMFYGRFQGHAEIAQKQNGRTCITKQCKFSFFAKFCRYFLICKLYANITSLIQEAYTVD